MIRGSSVSVDSRDSLLRLDAFRRKWECRPGTKASSGYGRNVTG